MFSIRSNQLSDDKNMHQLLFTSPEAIEIHLCTLFMCPSFSLFITYGVSVCFNTLILHGFFLYLRLTQSPVIWNNRIWDSKDFYNVLEGVKGSTTELRKLKTFRSFETSVYFPMTQRELVPLVFNYLPICFNRWELGIKGLFNKTMTLLSCCFCDCF